MKAIDGQDTARRGVARRYIGRMYSPEMIAKALKANKIDAAWEIAQLHKIVMSKKAPEPSRLRAILQLIKHRESAEDKSPAGPSVGTRLNRQERSQAELERLYGSDFMAEVDAVDG